MNPAQRAPSWCVATLYWAFLAACIAGLVLVGRPPARGSLPTVLTLSAITLVSYATVEMMLDRLGRALDAGIVMAGLALVIAGPIAGLVILLLPDVIRAARRPEFRRSLGLLANIVSYAAAVIAGELVLRAVATHPQGLQVAVAVLVCGAAMSVVNYLFARLLFAVLREGGRAGVLLRTELLAMLPTEMGMFALAAGCSLLLPTVGLVALVPFAGIVICPQLAIGYLIRIRPVSGVAPDRAAAIYRVALADQLQLSRHTRRAMDLATALRQGRPAHTRFGSALNTAMRYAWDIETCLRSPNAPYTASLGTQVLLVADYWSQLTAHGTRGLSHRDALSELFYGGLTADAPDALRAANAIVERELTVTADRAPVPRLHRLPVPRLVRQQHLAPALARLRA
jgi:riboflavin transporter FmnP